MIFALAVVVVAFIILAITHHAENNAIHERIDSVERRLYRIENTAAKLESRLTEARMIGDAELGVRIADLARSNLADVRDLSAAFATACRDVASRLDTLHRDDRP